MQRKALFRARSARLQEFVLAMFTEDFRQNGADVIRRVRETHPQTYLMAAVGLLPKQTQKIESPLADLTDAEIELIEQTLRGSRAQQINGTATEVGPLGGVRVVKKLIDPDDTKRSGS